jgi:hypothetical protein
LKSRIRKRLATDAGVQQTPATVKPNSIDLVYPLPGRAMRADLKLLPSEKIEHRLL